MPLPTHSPSLTLVAFERGAKQMHSCADEDKFLSSISGDDLGYFGKPKGEEVRSLQM